jgi:glutamine synthetase
LATPTRPRRPALLNKQGLLECPTQHFDSALAEQSGTKFILALFVDLRGKPCAKLVPVEAVDLLATEGVGLPDTPSALAPGAQRSGPDGDSGPGVVSRRSRSSRTASPSCIATRTTGEPWPYAPRVILKALIQRAADAGFEPWVGAEVEVLPAASQPRRQPVRRGRRRHRRAALLRRPWRHADVRPPDAIWAAMGCHA